MSCPRCDGPLTVRHEVDGREAACLACGWRPTRRHVEPVPDDPLAERTAYRHDRGCRVAPSCFACPLDECVFDEGARAMVRAERDARIREAKAEGATYRELVARFRVSEQTIKNVIYRKVA